MGGEEGKGWGVLQQNSVTGKGEKEETHIMLRVISLTELVFPVSGPGYL